MSLQVVVVRVINRSKREIMRRVQCHHVPSSLSDSESVVAGFPHQRSIGIFVGEDDKGFVIVSLSSGNPSVQSVSRVVGCCVDLFSSRY